MQIVNSVAQSDGGPARNSFELNLALNRIPNVSAGLVWIRSSGESTVISDFAANGGLLPKTPPAYLRVWSRKQQTISLASFWKRMASVDAVVLHGYFLVWVPVLVLLAATLRKKVFIMPHGALTPHELRRHRWKKIPFARMLELIMKRAGATIVTGSEREKSEIVDTLGEVAVEYAGVGTDAPQDPPLAREFSVPVRLVTLSRISPKKRIDLVIDAIEILLRDGIDARLSIAGSGPDRLVSSLRSLVFSRGLQSKVQFLGIVTGAAKSALLSKADIFVLPSEDENFGIAVAEAAAHGLMVVASENVASAKLLSPNVAHIAKEQSAQSVAEALQLCISEFEPSKRVLAYEEALGVYSWDAVARRWCSVIQAALPEVKLERAPVR